MEKLTPFNGLRNSIASIKSILDKKASKEDIAAFASKDYVDSKVPDGQSAHQVLVTDADGNAKWEDRVGYVESAEFKDFLSETTIDLSQASEPVTMLEFADVLIPGVEYTVIWNGKTYTSTAKEFYEMGMTVPYIGDISFAMPNIDSTGEPFMFFTIQNMMCVHAWDVMMNPEGDLTRTFKIGTMEEVISQIPEKFIPETAFSQSDWEVTDEEDVSFVKNKPFGVLERLISNHSYESTTNLTITGTETRKAIDLPLTDASDDFIGQPDKGEFYHIKGLISITVGEYGTLTLNVDENCMAGNICDLAPESMCGRTWIIGDDNIRVGIHYFDFRGKYDCLNVVFERRSTDANLSVDVICSVEDLSVTKIIPINSMYITSDIQRVYGDKYIVSPNGTVYSLTINNDGEFPERFIPASVKLPTVTTSDAGKFLRVNENGDWQTKEVDFITLPSTATVGQTIVVKSIDDTGKPTEWEAVDPWIITSSTEGSTKQFKLTIDDDGVLTATEVTA